MQDKEIELKFLINNDTKAKIIADLEKLATKGKQSHQIDTYYIPNFAEFEKDGETMECLRIREQNGRSVLCYKKIHREANPIYCDEYETEIESKDQMEKILFALGFEIQMVIDKERVSYHLDNFHFDFDSVKNLGDLMEVEIDSKANDSVSVDDIYSFVAKYNLTSKDVTYDGIQKLMKVAMSKK